MGSAAQPFVDWRDKLTQFSKALGNFDKPSSGPRKKADGTLPTAAELGWAVPKQVAKKPTQKTVKKRTAPLANKRTSRKKVG